MYRQILLQAKQLGRGMRKSGWHLGWIKESLTRHLLARCGKTPLPFSRDHLQQWRPLMQERRLNGDDAQKSRGKGQQWRVLHQTSGSDLHYASIIPNSNWQKSCFSTKGERSLHGRKDIRRTCPQSAQSACSRLLWAVWRYHLLSCWEIFRRIW